MAVASFGEYLSDDNWVFMKYIIEAHKHGASQGALAALTVEGALENEDEADH